MSFAITTSAAIKRINRKLRPEWQRLRTLRGDRGLQDLGRHYVLDIYRNRIVETHVNIEAYARDLGVLDGNETVENDQGA